MSYSGRKARRPAHGIVRVGAVCAVLAAVAVTPGAGATVSPQVVAPRLGYACTVSGATYRTEVQLTATFPDTGTAGVPIQPTGTAIAVTVPHAEIAGLAKQQATTVTATGELGIDVTHAGTSSHITWPAVGIQPALLPGKGSLVLNASIEAPPTTVDTPGDVTFTATGLVLLLTPHRADGSATTPPNVLIGCTLDSGQAGTLATVPVAGSTRPGGQTGPVTVGPAAGGPQPGTSVRHLSTKTCPPLPPGGYKLNPHLPPPPPPPPGSITNSAPAAGCAYVKGFSDVRKLHGAALVGPGFTNLDITLTVITNQKKNYAQFDNAGKLLYHGQHEFPPATATFLAFGFMPTTATITLKELGTINIYTIGAYNQAVCGRKCPTLATVESRVVLYVNNVLVNGVPLNIGNNCQAARPFDVILHGTSNSNPPYTIQQGGPLTGTITVPKFSGCGVSENLDPIFDASISGPGNFVKLTQGPVCFIFGGGVCPPPVPKPLR